jgi:hypothetical protein
MDGARPNNHQKTFVFTIEDFFNASAGCRYMFRNACGKGAAVPVQTVSPGYQCAQCGVRQFYSWDISEIFCFIGRLPGSDGHHLKPIPADFKFGAVPPRW